MEVEVPVKVGERVTKINSSLDRSGYVVTQGKNALDAIKKCETAINKIVILTENVTD